MEFTETAEALEWRASTTTKNHQLSAPRALP
jgi:hypothetical protein